ncbi:hypothetical protein F0562_031766 [Nyssa sinensis]|uniref:Uncharacterized protein n=1 Tax=Nyssa sinensis TaxID=561372 RepID=A0A5J5AUY2_9ASTE|nr:hypothetical protein F0562_031766 [Nyssa sinensis]
MHFFCRLKLQLKEIWPLMELTSNLDGLFFKIQPYKSNRANKYLTLPLQLWSVTMRSIQGNRRIPRLHHVDFTGSLPLTIALKLDQKTVCGRPVRTRCAVPKKVSEMNSKSMSASKKADNGGVSSVSGKIRKAS